MSEQSVVGDSLSPDHALIALILNDIDRERAWSLLLNRYSNLIYSVPLRYGLSSADAADIYQNVCESLWKNLGTLRDPDRLVPWLLKVASNQSWQFLQRRKRQHDHEKPLPDDLQLSDTTPRPEELLAHQDEWLNLNSAVAALPERCRTLIWLLYYDEGEHSYDEIAQQLGLAVGSIGPIRGRCLAQLKKLLRTDP